MKISILNPQLLINPVDKFTTGIVYLPILIASISGSLKKNNIRHNVIDLFGLNPSKIKKFENFYYAGENVDRYKKELVDCELVFLYANQVINHLSIMQTKNYIRKINTKAKIVILENTQAVTGYSLKDLEKEFITSENDFILIGEAEEKVIQIINN